MQMSLVPKTPSAPGLEIAIGFEPCRWIGGDYVNVLNAMDGQVLLAVADVSGKGLPAALVAGGVHSIVHSSIRAGLGLTKLAQSLNQYLLESMERQSFVTMAAALFDPKNGKIQLINAGHPPLLIFDSRGKVREAPYGHNPPLGVMPMTVEVDAMSLEPGELAILFTDGLTELLDSKNKMIGLQGLEHELSLLYGHYCREPLEKLSQLLKARLDEIHGGAAATDDRTFLLARRATGGTT
jgi:serine phosphatase RsbU (regulator of sigma subunit)